MSIQPYQPTHAELVAQADGLPGHDSWVAVLAPVVQLANAIAKTEFVPQAFRGNPEATAAAILTGREMGIGPMHALRHIHVVKGKPGQSAELMRALILQAGHKLRYVETTDTRCIVEGRRKDEQEWTRVAFTSQQARTAKIDLGGYPEDKLVARATSRLARRIFADVVGGLPALEELEDVEDGEAPAAPAKRTVKRGAARASLTALPAPSAAAPAPAPAAAQEGPPLPGEDEQEDDTSAPAPPAGGGITDAQMKMLHATFNDAGITERSERLAYASATIAREVTSSTELTKAEASQVIDALVEDTGTDDGTLPVPGDEGEAR